MHGRLFYFTEISLRSGLGQVVIPHIIIGDTTDHVILLPYFFQEYGGLQAVQRFFN